MKKLTQRIQARSRWLKLSVGLASMMMLTLLLNFHNQSLVASAFSRNENLVSLAQIEATNWYVAPTGDDAADCLTPETACRTIVAAIVKAASGDSIHIDAGTYVENLTIEKDISLYGADPHTTIIDGGGIDRVVDITSHLNVAVKLSQLTIRNGFSRRLGAGIYNGSENNLTIEKSIVSDNHIQCSGNCPSGEGGGGIVNRGALTLIGSTVSSNTIDTAARGAAGGGIHNDCCGTSRLPKITIINSTISNNRVSAAAPGSFGGGIFNASRMEITNTTISGNVANHLHYAPGNGGGIYNSHQLTLNSTTVIGNVANGSVGGVQNDARVEIKSSIVALNTGAIPDCGGKRAVSQGYNLIGNGRDCDFSRTIGDQVGSNDSPIDPSLTPLQDNGGPTWTHALLPDSAALDAADPIYCPTVDQRGISRPQGSACDIGAYETVPPVLVDVSRVTQGLEVDVTGEVFYEKIAGKDTLLRTQLYSLTGQAQMQPVVSSTCRMQALTQIVVLPVLGVVRIPISGPIITIPVDPFPANGLVNSEPYGFFNGSQIFNCWVPGDLFIHPGDYRFEMEVTLAGQLEPNVFSLGTHAFLPTEDLRVLLYRWQRPVDDPDFRVWDNALNSTLPATMEEVQRMYPLRAGTGNIDFSGDGPYPGLRYFVYPDVFECTASLFDPDLTWQQLFGACDAYVRADADQAIKRFNAALELWDSLDGRTRDRFDWGMVLVSSVSNNGGQSCHWPERTAGGDVDGSLNDAYIIAHELAHCMGQVAPESPHFDGGGHSLTDRIPTLLGLPMVNMRLRSDQAPSHALMRPYFGWSTNATSEGWEWNHLRQIFVEMPRPSLVSAPNAMAQSNGNTFNDNQPLFLLKGIINGEDRLTMFYSARIDDLELEQTTPAPTATYALIFLDANGMELARFPFQPDFSSAEGAPRSITDLLLTVPMPENSQRVAVQNEGVTIYEQEFSVAPPAVSDVVATQDSTGKVALQWTADDADSQNLAFAIFFETGPDQPPLLLTSGLRDTSYMFDTAYAPATTTGRLIVEVSDGYHTAVASSNPFTIGDKVPTVSISEPTGASDAVASQPITLVGEGYDYTDGLLPDEALTWMSDRDGALGKGRRLNASLSAGMHTLTLQAAASSGLVNETSVQLTVLADSDGDSLPDEYETAFDCLSPSVFDHDIDFDSDNLLPIGERAWQTNPCIADTDGDGISDGEEVRLGSDPLDAEDIPLPDLLSVSPAQVNLGECPNSTSQIVEVQATTVLAWSVTADADWLNVSGGGTGNGFVTISAQCQGLAEGEYIGQVLVSAVGSQPQIIEVHLSVLASINPPGIYIPIIFGN